MTTTVKKTLKKHLREKLLNLYMDNPQLGEDIDYEDDSVRLPYYKKVVNYYSYEDLVEQIGYFEE